MNAMHDPSNKLSPEETLLRATLPPGLRACLCSLLLAAGLASACQADLAVPQDAAVLEAGPCSPGDATPLPPDRLLVTTEQYGSGGGVTVIDLATGEPTINVALTSDDVTARWFNHRIYVLNRYGADNLMILDDLSYRLVRQVSVRPEDNQACNPHDLLFLSTCRAYLTCYEKPTIYAAHPDAPLPDVLVPAVDLSPLADADGLPEASHMARVGGEVYVALERLDRTNGWAPSLPSRLAVVDPESDELLGDIPLQGANPVGPLLPLAGTKDLVVACAGDWSDADAGIERVHTASSSSELVVGSDVLGGVPSAFTLDASGCGFALVTEPETYETGIVSFCLDGTVSPCIPVGTGTLSDVALGPDGVLYVTDRTLDAPGVRRFDAASCAEIAESPIPTGFPPGFTNPMLFLPRATEGTDTRLEARAHRKERALRSFDNSQEASHLASQPGAVSPWQGGTEKGPVP